MYIIYWWNYIIYSFLGHVEIVNLLAQNGAQLDGVHGSKNRTALHLAAQKGRERIAEILVKHGANVNKGKYIESTEVHIRIFYDWNLIFRRHSQTDTTACSSAE